MKQMTDCMRNILDDADGKKVIAVVGAGGKTSLLKELTQEFFRRGKKVFVTTSTHMYIEEDTLLTDDAQKIIVKLERDGYVMAGIRSGEKIKELSRETYENVCEKADIVLIEADGSKHMPLKFPNETEPVIYDNVTDVIVVWGHHAIGKTAKEACHRLEIAKEFMDITDDTVITKKHAEKLIRKGYLEPLKKKYPHLHLYVHCYIINK